MKKILAFGLAVFILLVVPITAEALTFSDVKGHWAETAIYEMVEHGVVNGFPDGTFRPNDPVQVDQFTKMLLMALVEEKPNGETWYKQTVVDSMLDNVFYRVYRERFDFQATSGYWAEGFMEEALTFGLFAEIDAWEKWRKKYQSPLTREAAAMLAYNYVFITEKPLEGNYVSLARTAIKDIEHGTYAQDRYNLQSMFMRGIITGYPDGNIRPLKTVTRAEALTIINRIIDKKQRLPFEPDLTHYDWLELPLDEETNNIHIFNNPFMREVTKTLYDNLYKTEGAIEFRTSFIQFHKSEEMKQEEIERYANVATHFDENISDLNVIPNVRSNVFYMNIDIREGSIERHIDALMPFANLWFEDDAEKFFDTIIEKRDQIKNTRNLENGVVTFNDRRVRYAMGRSGHSGLKLSLILHND